MNWITFIREFVLTVCLFLAMGAHFNRAVEEGEETKASWCAFAMLALYTSIVIDLVIGVVMFMLPKVVAR